MQNDLFAENARLSASLRKWQDAAVALRDEVEDANSEILALRRLFEEQKQMLIAELDRERNQRCELERELKLLRHSSKKPVVSTGTNTPSTTEVAVSTDEMSPHYLLVKPPVTDALQMFADALARNAGVLTIDLYQLFRDLGADSVEEICAHISEKDLLRAGVPLMKARAVMNLVAQKTREILYAP